MRGVLRGHESPGPSSQFRDTTRARYDPAMHTDGSFIPYAALGVVMYVAVVVYRLITGKWMGKQGQERLEIAGALLLLGLLVGVTVWYA